MAELVGDPLVVDPARRRTGVRVGQRPGVEADGRIDAFGHDPFLAHDPEAVAGIGVDHPGRLGLGVPGAGHDVVGQEEIPAAVSAGLDPGHGGERLREVVPPQVPRLVDMRVTGDQTERRGNRHRSPL
jgi:hypothetical protein